MKLAIASSSRSDPPDGLHSIHAVQSGGAGSSTPYYDCLERRLERLRDVEEDCTTS
jgi:hypothetical protein